MNRLWLLLIIGAIFETQTISSDFWIPKTFGPDTGEASIAAPASATTTAALSLATDLVDLADLASAGASSALSQLDMGQTILPTTEQASQETPAASPSEVSNEQTASIVVEPTTDDRGPASLLEYDPD